MDMEKKEVEKVEKKVIDEKAVGKDVSKKTTKTVEPPKKSANKTVDITKMSTGELLKMQRKTMQNAEGIKNFIDSTDQGKQLNIDLQNLQAFELELKIRDRLVDKETAK